MSAFYGICEKVIFALEHDKILVATCSESEAIELLWTILTIHNWEQLTLECGWSTNQYLARLKKLLNRTFMTEIKL
jgi:hypothetical protein